MVPLRPQEEKFICNSCVTQRPSAEREQHIEPVDVEDGQVAEDAIDGVPDESGGEADQPRAAASPRTPSAADRAAHELTHFPYRSWCEDCVRGRATGHKHSSVLGEAATSTVARVSMDYGYLREDETATSDEHNESTIAKMSMTILVMVETMRSSAWA